MVDRRSPMGTTSGSRWATSSTARGDDSTTQLRPLDGNAEEASASAGLLGATAEVEAEEVGGGLQPEAGVHGLVVEDERPANVLITVRRLDDKGNVVATDPQDYPISTTSYQLSGQSERQIDIFRGFPRLCHANTPLQNRSGRVKTASRQGGRYRPLGAVDKLLDGTAHLEFPALAYLPISDPDEFGIHHAELFLEDQPTASAPAQPRPHTPARAPTADRKHLGVAPSTIVRNVPTVAGARPSAPAATLAKPRPQSPMELTDEDDEEDNDAVQVLSPIPHSASLPVDNNPEIIAFFRRTWQPPAVSGKARKMRLVLRRIRPVADKYEELMRVMKQKNSGGFEIPSTSDYPRALHGLTLTQAHLGSIYYNMGDTTFNEDFGWFVTKVHQYPRVQEWRNHPTTAKYAHVFNEMSRTAFRTAFKANWPDWQRQPEWIPSHALEQAREQERSKARRAPKPLPIFQRIPSSPSSF